MASPGSGPRSEEVLEPIYKLKDTFMLKLGQVKVWEAEQARIPTEEPDLATATKSKTKKSKTPTPPASPTSNKSSSSISSSSSSPSSSSTTTSLTTPAADEDDFLINYSLWWETSQIILPTSVHFPAKSHNMLEGMPSDGAEIGLIRPVHTERAYKIGKIFTESGDKYNPDFPVLFARAFIYSFLHSFLFIHLFIHSFIHSFMHSFIHVLCYLQLHTSVTYLVTCSSYCQLGCR